MKLPGDPFRLPPEKRPARARAKRLEVVTIIFVLSIIGVISAVMGASQTMKAMWVEDVLSLVPPIAFLIGRRYSDKPPDQQLLALALQTAAGLCCHQWILDIPFEIKKNADDAKSGFSASTVLGPEENIVS